MSQFSGKCDLYDSVVMIGKYDIKDIKLFLDKNGRSYPLKIETPKDLIPYYPYVPYMSHGMDNKWCGWISENFVDKEERELLTSQLEWLLKEYRKCKRKKIEFNPETTWYNEELINRVKEQGEKATIEGIHRSISNYFRKTLAEEMEKNGYKDSDIIKWVYPDAWYMNLREGWDWRTDNY